MEGGASASDMSAIWAALQAADDAVGLPRATSHTSATRSSAYAVAGFTDDAADEEEDEEEEEEDDEDDDEMAPVMPQRVGGGSGGGGGAGGGGGLLPPSFYSATSSGLPDVVPAFLLPAHRPYTSESTSSSHGTTTATTAASSSEMFLDDILRSHDEPFGGTQRLTPERLSQLEDNYERKKKRAKINRRDLNSRFQELMDLLRLKEDRKLNRAKVLEKAIEQIHKLTDELAAAKLQLQRHTASQSNSSSTGPPPQPFHGAGLNGGLPLHIPLPLPQWTPGVNMAATQMMWMPMLPPPAPQPVPRPASARARSNATKTARATTAATGNRTPTTASMQTQTSPERPSTTSSTTTMAVRRPGLKRGREAATTSGMDCSAPRTSNASSSSLVWLAQEVPALLELCDAWTLRELMRVSVELRSASRRDALWRKLCERRWRLDPSPSTSTTSNAFALWTQLDAANEMPRCFCVTGTTVAFASGRVGGVALWASLVRRSNGRTTRTVLVDGKAVVRQVVELNVVVQNLDARAPLELTDELHVCSRGLADFELLTSDSKAHLAPHLVTVNDVPRGSTSVTGVELFHGDFCVLSVFVACDGLDLEQQFLDQVDSVEMQCERWTHGRDQPPQTLHVAARARHVKHTRIAGASSATTSDSSNRDKSL